MQGRARDFPLNPWTANALSCRNHSRGRSQEPGAGTEAGEGAAAGAGSRRRGELLEPLPELMQKFCFIKFSSQAPNPNTYSYTLQCLTLTHCAQGGLLGEEGVESGGGTRGCGCSSQREKETESLDEGRIEKFFFSYQTIFYDKCQGGRMGIGHGRRWRRLFGFFGFAKRGCGWAWQHIGTLPAYATEKFIHFLLTFHDKTQQRPLASRPLTPPSPHPLAQPQHFVIYN